MAETVYKQTKTNFQAAATASGVVAIVTETGVELIRLSCTGHRYSTCCSQCCNFPGDASLVGFTMTLIWSKPARTSVAIPLYLSVSKAAEISTCSDWMSISSSLATSFPTALMQPANPARMYSIGLGPSSSAVFGFLLMRMSRFLALTINWSLPAA